MALDTAGWALLVGGLMLTISLTAPFIGRLPATPAILSLIVGIVVGPTLLGLFHFNPLRESKVLEVLAEGAVLIALFSAGIKMPVPVTLSRWRPPILLAFLSMAATVAFIAAFGHYFLALPLGASILLGAILAPTDPVLATDIQARHPGDRDQLRFTLTCEAGMNDGTAFPFIMLGLGFLGLHDLGDYGWRWLLVDIAWAIPGAVAIGVAGGYSLARLTAWMHHHLPERSHFGDLMGLGLIGVVYGASVLCHSWGFLAVFFAAVALRQTEMKLAERNAGRATVAPYRQFEGEAIPDEESSIPQVGIRSLVFKENLERLSEIVLVLLIGGMLFRDSWSWRAVSLALFLFLVARPVSVLLGLVRTRTTAPMRAMAGWFGVRGIGSLYYLMYAVNHGLHEDMAVELVHLTLIPVTLSILVHGFSIKPLIQRFWNVRSEKFLEKSLSNGPTIPLKSE